MTSTIEYREFKSALKYDGRKLIYNELRRPESQDEVRMAKVEIYTAAACPFCSRAMDLLSAKNADFEEIDVTLSISKRQVMRSRSNGRTSVPQVFIDNNHIGGCDDLCRLDQAGSLDKILSSVS